MINILWKSNTFDIISLSQGMGNTICDNLAKVLMHCGYL